ncbi:MAG: hypothetical protein RL754_105 [Bacteroidota bacterium]|jgi:glycosyltransferase involved in cell wall biosynthesis
MRIALLARKSLFQQPGGDTVQVEETARALSSLGHTAIIISPEDPLPEGTELLHFFNIGRPADAYPHWKTFRGKKVISTIFVDYSAVDQFRFPTLYKTLGPHGTEYFKTIARGMNRSDRFPPLPYLLRGQRRSIQNLLRTTDVLITSSQSEYNRLKPMLGARPIIHHVIPLGVNTQFFSEETKSAQKLTGLIMVGRMEYLKNQLTIIRWATAKNIPLTVVGGPNTNQPEYSNECNKVAGTNVRFVGHLSTEELIHELDAHSALIIPSHFETFSIVGLEAAARGLHVIANDVADMNETLQNLATFVSMENEEALTDAVNKALAQPSEHKKSQTVLETHAWDVIAKQLLRAYGA